MLLTPRQHPCAHRQRGAVAIILGLTLAVLIGFAGLAIDLGRFFVIKTELQNGMDACALAAASQLRPGQNNPNALTKAIAYGRVFSTGGEGNTGAIKNRANFQSMVIDIATSQITFSDALVGPYEVASDADYNTAAFAKCEYPLAGLPILFMRVLNPLLNTQTVSAMAAATLAPSASACAIPVALCRQPGGIASNNFGLTMGQWYSRPDEAGEHCDPDAPGSFCWVDFTPPGGGASELADLLTGPGHCSTFIGSEVGEQGTIASLETAWNSRFGVYRPGGGQPDLTSAPPDVTGYGYNASTWTAGANAYSGSSPGGTNYLNAASTYLPYQLSPPNPYSSISSAQHQTFGRNRRVVVAPVVNCSELSAHGATVEGMACVLMLEPMLGSSPVSRVEFLGLSTTAGSPCATNGEPGTFGPLVPQLVQ